MKLKQLMTGLALTLAIFLSSGCATTEHSAYSTIGTVGATANAAIGAYSTYVQQHSASSSDIAMARLYIQNYVDALETARHVVTAYKQGQAKGRAIDQALVDLNFEVEQLTAVLSDLSKPLAPTP